MPPAILRNRLRAIEYPEDSPEASIILICISQWVHVRIVVEFAASFAETTCHFDRSGEICSEGRPLHSSAAGGLGRGDNERYRPYWLNNED
jgi:hypothetical protein